MIGPLPAPPGWEPDVLSFVLGAVLGPAAALFVVLLGMIVVSAIVDAVAALLRGVRR